MDAQNTDSAHSSDSKNQRRRDWQSQIVPGTVKKRGGGKRLNENKEIIRRQWGIGKHAYSPADLPFPGKQNGSVIKQQASGQKPGRVVTYRVL